MQPFNTAPNPGRAPKVVENADGSAWRIHPLPPRQALRVGFYVVKVLGQPLGALLSGAGLELDGLEGTDGNPLRVQLQHLAHSARARELLIGKLIEGLGNMTPDDLEHLVDELLLAPAGSPVRLEHRMAAAGAPFVPIRDGDMLDTLAGDLWGLANLVRHAFVLSALPTSTAVSTDEETAGTAGTSSPSAKTPSV